MLQRCAGYYSDEQEVDKQERLHSQMLTLSDCGHVTQKFLFSGQSFKNLYLDQYPKIYAPLGTRAYWRTW